MANKKDTVRCRYTEVTGYKVFNNYLESFCFPDKRTFFRANTKYKNSSPIKYFESGGYYFWLSLDDIFSRKELVIPGMRIFKVNAKVPMLSNIMQTANAMYYNTTGNYYVCEDKTQQDLYDNVYVTDEIEITEEVPFEDFAQYFPEGLYKDMEDFRKVKTKEDLLLKAAEYWITNDNELKFFETNVCSSNYFRWYILDKNKDVKGIYDTLGNSIKAMKKISNTESVSNIINSNPEIKEDLFSRLIEDENYVSKRGHRAKMGLIE